jgi:hypothetical protein
MPTVVIDEREYGYDQLSQDAKNTDHSIQRTTKAIPTAARASPPTMISRD